MKTAISIPDPLFQMGEKLAKQLKVSRSELYAQALAYFAKDHGDDNITQTLNEIYECEDSSVDPALWHMASASLPQDEW